jgi:hypothetical protein
MNFTFDCILLKDNKAVREDVVLTLNDAPNEHIKTLDFFNNSLEWLNKGGTDILKKILLELPFNIQISWENLYPEYISETKNLIRLSSIIYNGTFNIKYDYLSAFQNKEEEKYNKLTELFNNTREFKVLDKELFENLTSEIYKDFSKYLNNQKHQVINAIKSCLYSKVEAFKNTIFIAHDYNGFQNRTFKKADVSFLWSTNYGFGWSSYDKSSITFLKGNLNHTDYPIKYKVNIYGTHLQSPFSGNSIINELNEFLMDEYGYKLKYAENQIRKLKAARELEVKYLEIIEKEVLPGLVIELTKNEMIKKLPEINEEDLVKYNEVTFAINEKINRYNKQVDEYFNITSEALSVFEKKKKIELLKERINFWIGWVKGEQDLLKEV